MWRHQYVAEWDPLPKMFRQSKEPSCRIVENHVRECFDIFYNVYIKKTKDIYKSVKASITCPEMSVNLLIIYIFTRCKLNKTCWLYKALWKKFKPKCLKPWICCLLGMSKDTVCSPWRMLQVEGGGKEGRRKKCRPVEEGVRSPRLSWTAESSSVVTRTVH